MEVDDEEAEVTRVTLEKDKFWVSEEQSRLRNSAMTPFESHQLANHEWNPRAMPNVTKVMMQFGAKKGAGAACVSLLGLVIGSKQPQPGEVCSLRSPEFTLAKHMMISNWKKLAFPELKGAVEQDNLVTCYCVPRTSFMLAGCMHKKHHLTANIFYLQRLCVTCSTCLRCNKHLGFNDSRQVVLNLPSNLPILQTLR